MATNADEIVGASAVLQQGATMESLSALKKKSASHAIYMHKIFMDLYYAFKSEISVQLLIVDDLWVNTKRIIEIWDNRSTSGKFDGLSEEEHKLLFLINYGIKYLQDSNAKLMASTKPLYQSIKILDGYLTRLFDGPGTNFIVETKTNKTLHFIAEGLRKFYQYFSSCIRRMNYCTNEYIFNDQKTVKEYRSIIQPALEIEERLVANIDFCRYIDVECIE